MPRPKRCRICKKVTKYRLRSGRCLRCALNKVKVVTRQMKTKKGKYYKKWRENILRGVLQSDKVLIYGPHQGKKAVKRISISE